MIAVIYIVENVYQRLKEYSHVMYCIESMRSVAAVCTL